MIATLTFGSGETLLWFVLGFRRWLMILRTPHVSFDHLYVLFWKMVVHILYHLLDYLFCCWLFYILDINPLLDTKCTNSYSLCYLFIDHFLYCVEVPHLNVIPFVHFYCYCPCVFYSSWWYQALGLDLYFFVICFLCRLLGESLISPLNLPGQ